MLNHISDEILHSFHFSVNEVEEEIKKLSWQHLPIRFFIRTSKFTLRLGMLIFVQNSRLKCSYLRS